MQDKLLADIVELNQKIAERDHTISNFGISLKIRVKR